MPWNQKVVWNEGMFLQPQHFQQHDRYLERLVEGRTSPLIGQSWGFSSIELDTTALALGKVQLTIGRGLMPDGTPFDFPPYDAAPPPLDINIDVKDEVIVLALPLRRPGIEEVDLSDHTGSGLARYTAHELEVSDVNANADRSALIQVGQLRLRLMRESDVTDAYSVLGVVRITERRADNQLIPDKTYIPPILHAGANATLLGYLREVHGLLHQRAAALAGRIAQPGRGGVAEVADFLLLQTTNRYEPVLAHLLTLPQLHPERLFALLLGLAGDLATFSQATRRPPVFPEYQHDALDRCYTPLIAELRRSLSMVLEQNAIPIELQDRKYGVRVAVIADLELLKSAGFVLAVTAQIPADALRTRFPSQVKIGPVERIRDLVNLQLPGIPLRPLPVAPRQIPYHAGFNYFEIERGGELWQQLERSGGLAMHIAGDFPGLELEFWAIRG
ncbi:MAG: type VI secretion system baseplate subunit TssK [Gammaproteobacteria bacterium]